MLPLTVELSPHLAIRQGITVDNSISKGMSFSGSGVVMAGVLTLAVVL